MAEFTGFAELRRRAERSGSELIAIAEQRDFSDSGWMVEPMSHLLSSS
ncbi:hypothetical protein [Thermosporothrix hazakensis]|jgi:hypothetical protein|nr:hypothetical protein [Thermosporothrix hazakensis]